MLSNQDILDIVWREVGVSGVDQVTPNLAKLAEEYHEEQIRLSRVTMRLGRRRIDDWADDSVGTQYFLRLAREADANLAHLAEEIKQTV